MAVLVGASWMLDLRLLGINRQVPLSSYRWVFPVIAVGLVVNVLTGVLLFMKAATTMGTAVPFFIKMSLVVAGAATLMPLRNYVRSGAAGEIPSSAKMLAIVSVLAWTGAVTAGRLLAYVVL